MVVVVLVEEEVVVEVVVEVVGVVVVAVVCAQLLEDALRVVERVCVGGGGAGAGDGGGGGFWCVPSCLKWKRLEGCGESLYPTRSWSCALLTMAYVCPVS